MSTKDEIQAAVKNRFRTATMEIAPGQTLTFRELSEGECIALNKVNFPEVAGDGPRKANPDGQNILRWIAATISPAFIVEELGAWPPPLVMEAWAKSQEANGSPDEDAGMKAAAKNS